MIKSATYRAACRTRTGKKGCFIYQCLYPGEYESQRKKFSLRDRITKLRLEAAAKKAKDKKRA